MAGIRVKDRKILALKDLERKVLTEGRDVDVQGLWDLVRPWAKEAIDCYILVNGGIRCSKCGEAIHSSAKSGLCRGCYNEKYNKKRGKKPERKLQKLEGQRRVRRSRKLEILRGTS